MDERMQLLETYFATLITKGERLPREDEHKVPHFRSVSAASGVDFGYLVKEPYRQRVLLAAEEIGLTQREGTPESRLEAKFIQNQSKLDIYLRWLNENALKLPEDPTHRGQVFFAQVAVEAGLAPNALAARNISQERAYNVRLRQSVEKAASNLGIEVRVLPQSPGHQQIPFTYEQLLEKGTEERKKELKDSSSAAGQLSNTRYALNLFRQILRLEATAPIGPEFVAGFKSSLEKAIGEILNARSKKKFKTEINRWQDIYRRLLKGPSIPEDIHQAIIHLADRSGLSLCMLSRLIGISLATMRAWYEGRETPSLLYIPSFPNIKRLIILELALSGVRSSDLLSEADVRLTHSSKFITHLPPSGLSSNLNYFMLGHSYSDSALTFPL